MYTSSAPINFSCTNYNIITPVRSQVCFVEIYITHSLESFHVERNHKQAFTISCAFLKCLSSLWSSVNIFMFNNIDIDIQMVSYVQIEQTFIFGINILVDMIPNIIHWMVVHAVYSFRFYECSEKASKSNKGMSRTKHSLKTTNIMLFNWIWNMKESWRSLNKRILY